MPDSWKVTALSLATTFAVAYLLCAIFDAMFPPFGMLAAIAPAVPWPISGTPVGFLTGFVSFAGAGLALGALFGAAAGFWRKALH